MEHDQLVPQRNTGYLHTRKKASFQCSQNESAGDQASIILDQSGESRHDGPAGRDQTYPAGRSYLFDDKIAGRFAQHVRHEQQADGCGILRVGNPQICFHAIQFGIADVDTVQEGEKVQQHGRGYNVEIKLAE